MKAGLLGQLRVQTMLLDPPYKAPKVVQSHRPPKRLSAKKKRKLKLHEVPKEKQVYELYVPLHELWLKYMEDVLQVGPDAKRYMAIILSIVSNHKSTINDVYVCHMIIVCALKWWMFICVMQWMFFFFPL